MAKSRFGGLTGFSGISGIGEGEGMIGVMGSLSSLSASLPDERPIRAVAVVENTGRCPEGFFPILKTYDEDSDADLWRQPVIFGKRTCRYLCISKSKDVSTSKLIALSITGVGDAPPSGFTAITYTSDTNKSAWRRRQLLFMSADISSSIDSKPPLTDIIVCSKLKKAPMGFQHAGEINGLTICYKTTSTLNGSHSPLDYQNILYKTPTPEPKQRAPPERPPRVGALVAELNKLNMQNENNCPGISGDSSNHDYEILNTGYSLTPSRPAPAVPTRTLTTQHSTNYYNYNTLGSWNPLEGVSFVLNPKLSGNLNINSDLPNIKKRSLMELNKLYSYNFLAERQT